jgi:flagellar biosynthesis/type III secretory pathway M-ring protein FliF/YscJ
MVRAAIVPGDLTETNVVVKVTETTFARPLASKIETPDEGGWFTDPSFLLDLARRFSLVILVIGALLALRMSRGPKKATSELAEIAARPQLAGQGLADDHLLSGAETNPTILRSQITNALQHNPEEVKKLFRHWVESKQNGA